MSFKTIAVLLNENRKPRKTAVFQGITIKSAKAVVKPIVPNTCIPPPIKTLFLIAASSLSENSIPITKRRKMIPISDKSSTSCEELIRLNA